MSSLTFKIATEPWEFEQIHALNYRTFVEEIPQHLPNSEQKLVDKFHEQNTYIICLSDQKVVGMIAIRGERPFSLDAKLDNLDSYLPPGKSICEIRLLSIEPSYRSARVFAGLISKGVEYGVPQGYDLAIMSGTTRQQRLYKHIGCVPFGPPVGRAGAMYQPMYLTLDVFAKTFSWIPRLREIANKNV